MSAARIALLGAGTLLAVFARSDGYAIPENQYLGQRIARVEVENVKQALELPALIHDVFESRVTPGRLVRVRATDEELSTLRERGYALDIEIHDIAQHLRDLEEQHKVSRRQMPESLLELERQSNYHSRYHTYNEIMQFVRGLARPSNPLVEISSMPGRTAQNRTIPVIAIGNRNATFAMYVLICICGLQYMNQTAANLHAREWISGASVQFAAQQLISSYMSQPYANRIRIYIAPMANPDGYEHSRLNDRLWRNNMRKIGDCLGVDLNRNFDGYNSWQPSACPSNTYGGPAPFSEPETKAISSFLRSLRSRHRMVGAIDFHAFACVKLGVSERQWIMWPPGFYGAPNTVPDGNNLERGGVAMNQAIIAAAGNNAAYKTTTAMDFYPAAGACDDWMYDKIVQSPNPRAAVDKGLVYTIELPPSESASDAGFILPPSQIVPVGRQVTAAITALLKYIMANNVPRAG